MNWVPTADRVLLRFDEKEERVSTGGVILSVNAAEESHVKQATVEATGRDVREVKTGQRVLLSGYAGTTVDGDESLRIVKETDLLGVLDV